MSAGGGDYQDTQKPEDGTNDTGDVSWHTRASNLKPTPGKKSVSFLLPPFVLKDGESPSWKEANVFGGRYVTSVSTALPFRVSRQYVQPKLNQELSLRSLTEDILQTICGIQDLKNVLLAITRSQCSEEGLYLHKVHIYRLDNQRHLCATSLTRQECKLIEQYHDDDNYSILHCSRSIELVDAARNSPIKTQIFETVREGSPAVRSTWYKGHPMSLSLRLKNRLRIGLHTTHNRFGISSLREPKIPIRMTRFTCIESKEETTVDEQTLAQDPKRTPKVLNRRRAFILEMRQRKLRKPSKLGDNMVGIWSDSSQFSSQDIPKIKSILKNPLRTKPPRKDTKSKENLAEEGNTEAISSDEDLQLIPTLSVFDNYSSESELNIKKSVRFTDLQEGHAKAVEARLKHKRGRTLFETVDGDLTEEAEFDCDAGRNGEKMLPLPQEIYESESLISVPSVVPDDSSNESIIEKSSSFKSFDHKVSPVASTTSYSPESGAHIANELQKLNAKQAFRKFGILVDRINRDIQPQSELLLTFFQLVESLNLKMLVRLELKYLGWGEEPRYVVECYRSEDRQEFVASIGLLCQQLHHFTDVCPGAARNLRFVDDAFELTNLPKKLTGWLKTGLSAIHARGLYDLLGELTLLVVHPPADLLTPNGEDRAEK